MVMDRNDWTLSAPRYKVHKEVVLQQVYQVLIKTRFY